MENDEIVTSISLYLKVMGPDIFNRRHLSVNSKEATSNQSLTTFSY